MTGGPSVETSEFNVSVLGVLGDTVVPGDVGVDVGGCVGAAFEAYDTAGS